MMHIYFKPGGKVLFGTDPQTAFDPEGVCPEVSASAMASATATATATASASASASSSAPTLAQTGGAFSLTSLAALAPLALLVGAGVLAFGVIRRS
jgi:uncharacterized protein HemX